MDVFYGLLTACWGLENLTITRILAPLALCQPRAQSSNPGPESTAETEQSQAPSAGLHLTTRPYGLNVLSIVAASFSAQLQKTDI